MRWTSTHSLVPAALVFLSILATAGCSTDPGPDLDIDRVAVPGATMQEMIRLDFDDAPTLPSQGGIVAWDPAGETAAFVDVRVPSEILLFDRDGQFETILGGLGEGPGEYREINATTFDGQGGLWVISRRGNRVDVYTPDFELDVSFMPERRVHKVRPLGEALLVAVTSGPEGSRVELLRPDGSLEPLDSALPGNVQGELVAIATDGESRYWLSLPHEFGILAGHDSGSRAPLELEEPDWFGATYPDDFQEEFAEMLDMRGATILSLEYDPQQDVLWALAGVPAVDVDASKVRQAFQGGDPQLLEELPATLIDHVLIGVDPGTHEVIAEERFDYHPTSLASELQYEVSDDGVRVSIIRPVVAN